MKKSISFLACLLLAITAGAQQPQADSLEQYVNRVMAEWKIPGMAVAMEKDGKVLFCNGFGVKELQGAVPFGDKADMIYPPCPNPDKGIFVDEHTLFQIGSTSKSFTGALMAELVDEGKVSWEDTVKNILPDFEMYDPWVTANMQVKDIMTHRFGIAEQAGTYIPNLGYDRNDIYRMFKYLKPAYSFRGDFQYSNIAFEIGARIIEKVTGKSWEENVQERIFDKIGMSDSRTGGRAFAAAANAAVPHDWGFRGDSMYVVPEYGPEQALWWLTQVNPEGGVNCSVTDLLKWAEFHMNGGRTPDPDGQPGDSVQVISARQMNYLHKGQTIAAQTDDRLLLYAQGWYVEQTSKGRVYYHTGTTWGFTTLCFFIPQMKLAGAILVDAETSSNPRFAIMRRAIDIFSGRPAEDYSSEWLAEWYSDRRAEAARKAEANAKLSAVDSVPAPEPSPESICGKYTNDPLFGDAEVSVEKGRAFITIGKQGWKHPLKHEKGSEYSFRSDGHEFRIKFSIDSGTGEAAAFHIEWGYQEPFPDWTRNHLTRE